MTKKNLLLGGIFVLLIIFAFLINGPFDKIKNSLFGPKNYLSKVEINDIQSINIVNDGKEVNLILNDQGWKVDGTKDFYADDTLIETIIESLKKLKEEQFYLVSDNIDKKADFKTDSSGIKVELNGDKIKPTEFLIGRLAPGSENTYISTSDSSNIYSVKVDLLNAFNKKEWRDLTIFSSSKENISSIRFQYPNREFTLAKEDGAWKGKTPYLFDVDQEKIEKIIDIMTNLKADKIPEQSFEGTGLEKNLIIIEAKGDDVNNTIMVGEANEEGMYYAKKSSSDNIYLISSSIEIELDKRISQLE